MLQGKLSAPATLGGALQGGVGLRGTLAGGGSIHPVYDGATEFTPTESAQTVETEGKVVTTDLTIDAIPSVYIVPSGKKSISANGAGIDVASYAEVDVDVQPSLQSKTATPTETAQTVTPSTGYDGLSSVSVGAISSTYVGSGVHTLDLGDDVMILGDVLYVKQGYNDAGGDNNYTFVPFSALMPYGEVFADAAYDSNGLITATAVYESTDPDWTNVTYSFNDTRTAMLQLPTQAATTITPTTSSQTAVPAGKFTTGAVTVAAIPSQYIVPTGTYTVTGSGTHDVTEYASASVASATPTNSSESEYLTSSGARKWRYRPKTIVPTAGWAAQHSASNPINGFWTTYDAIPTGTTVTPTTSSQTIGGADTMMEGAVTVAAIPPEYIVPTGTKSIAANGTGIDVTDYAAVDVAVPTPTPSLQSKSKSYTPTETAQSETVSADGGYDGLSSVAVSVGAISSTYVGSGITRRDSTDLGASGATVSVPAGYYENAASKAVSSGSATAPASISATGASISYGLTNITLSKTGVSVTPTVSAGYVASGTAGSTDVYLSAPADFQPETTWHPSTSDQTILAGKILQGHQHIKAVTTANLDAGNIKDGVTVKIGDASDDDCVASVTGTYTGGGSSVKTATGTFTGNGTRTIDVACTFEPDIVYFTSNPGTTASSGTVAAIIVRDMMAATRYRNNSTTNSHYAIPDIANLNTSGSSYSWRATYANSKVTLYCYSSNARGLLTNGRTYSYTFIKWT